MLWGVTEWGPAESQEENEPFSSLSDVPRGDCLSFNPPFILILKEPLKAGG